MKPRILSDLEIEVLGICKLINVYQRWRFIQYVEECSLGIR